MRNFICALAILLAAGCSRQGEGAATSGGTPAPASSPPAKKLLVMATIAPMYCFAKNIAGNLADVEMIVPPGDDPRTFVPSQEEAARIMQADMVVENGFGFEGWMDRIEARGLKPGAIRVLAARGTGPGIPGLPGDSDSPPGAGPDFTAGPPDPHVWLDPLMAIKEVQNIRDALMARDPKNADEYLANENQYEAALRELDDDVGLVTVDIASRSFVCLGNSFTYFLSRYQLPVAAAANTPGEAIQAARQKKADAILAPKGTDAAILNGTGLRLVIADPMECGPASTDFYEKETRANAEALREGLMR